MSGVLGSVLTPGVLHASMSCVTVASGQVVCEGTSAGFFASLGAFLYIEIVIIVLAIIATVKVITKAGYSGWWVLIALVPVVGSIFFLVFAFSTWPVTQELEMLRAQVAHFGGGRPPWGSNGGDRGPSGFGPAPSGPPAPTMDPESVAIPSFSEFIGGRAVQTTGSSAPRTASPDTGRPVPAPGWYGAPEGPPGRLRYWDGTAWTDHYH